MSSGSHADLLVYVVGAPQAQHLQMVFEVARMAGWLVPPTEAVHVSFGSVLGDDRKMLRSRTGDSVKLIELLDEAIERAAAAIAEKNPDLDDDQRADVARMIGIGAVKYADLSTDRVKDYVFDWDRMLAFDGNTAPYLQYAHARICSIFRRAELDRGRRCGRARDHARTPRRNGRSRCVCWRTRRRSTRRSRRTARTSCAPTCSSWRRTSPSFYEHCPILQGRRAAALEPAGARRPDRPRAASTASGSLGIDAPEQM